MANGSEAEKSSTISDTREHLRVVKMERAQYKAVYEAKRVFKHTLSPMVSSLLHRGHTLLVTPTISKCTTPSTMPIYPSDPLQPGPIYFLTPRKCTVFGVNCEALPRQVNFLTDEAGDCGKGANAVVSRLDFFFHNHGFGEKDVFLHADNCTGQNKNNCMVQYLAWRVMTNQHSNITLSFLPVGHTKFSPDWCFGLFKRQYRRTKVGSLQNIAKVVNTSAKCNVAQLVSREDVTTIVPTLDWTNFFAM